MTHNLIITCTYANIPRIYTHATTSKHTQKRRFPKELLVWSLSESFSSTAVASLPLAENIPLGHDACRTGPRSHAWRHDADSTITWIEAQDGGDPKKSVEFRVRHLCLLCGGCRFDDMVMYSEAAVYAVTCGFECHSKSWQVTSEAAVFAVTCGFECHSKSWQVTSEAAVFVTCITASTW